jgi:hypothetical protein
MTFKAYGARQLRAAIDSNIEIMRYLADRIDQSQDFIRLGRLHKDLSLESMSFV